MRVLAIAILVGATTLAAGQNDPLRTARDLYASAAYVEALAELARIEPATAAPATARDADAYRVFCLFALDRAAEAQRAAESLVRRDPALSIDQFPDASPRIAAMFASVRRRLLPQMLKDEFRATRALAVEKSPEAESRLQHVRELLDTAEHIGAWDETLADIRLIVDGFLDLVHVPEPRNVRDTAAAALAPASPPALVTPIPIFQPQPNVPSTLFSLVRQLRRTSRIEVLINEQGTVDDVTIDEPVSPAYDKLIVATARTWRYKPALKDGVPIKFVSTVVINVSRE